MFSNSRSTVIMGLFSASVAASGLALGQAEDDDTIRNLVSRLDLESYKTTIRGLTQFGDRRQGTERNRQAVDWIEAWLPVLCIDSWLSGMPSQFQCSSRSRSKLPALSTTGM